MGFLSVGYVLRPGGGSLGEPVSRPPNVLVIDIDTLSYDHVGVQKNGVTTTPHIDALAERGVRFTHAFSHSGWTLPALSASFSGRLSVPVRMEGGGNSWRQSGTRDFAEICRVAHLGRRRDSIPSARRSHRAPPRVLVSRDVDS